MRTNRRWRYAGHFWQPAIGSAHTGGPTPEDSFFRMFRVTFLLFQAPSRITRSSQGKEERRRAEGPPPTPWLLCRIFWGLPVPGLRLGLELSSLDVADAVGPVGGSVGTRSLSLRLELTSLELTNTVRPVGSSVGGRGGGLRLELTSLGNLVLGEVGDPGGGAGVTLVGTSETRDDLGSAQGVLSANIVRDGGSLGLGSAGGAPDLALRLLEGGEVKDDIAARALEAQLVVGVVTGLEGLEGISVLSALGAGLSRHV